MVVLTAGDVLADYLLLRPIGVGGSADVFLAENAGRAVALKIARAHDGSAAARMDREAAIGAEFSDPHVVPVIARGRSHVRRDGAELSVPRDWLALRYVDGPPATALVPRDGAEPDLPAVVGLLADVASALDAAHGQGIVHRDVKPGNILVETGEDGASGFLTDFGTAVDEAGTARVEGTVDLSIGYAAPESLRGGPAIPATDEYGFAATAFELLTGVPPYPRATRLATTFAHLHAAPPAPDGVRPWLPRSLTAVFAKALAKRPEDRYQTCGELAGILARTLRDVEPPPRGRRHRR
ncbi:hypothetical protein GCM10009581_25120 [Tsukamurella strandjordii]